MELRKNEDEPIYDDKVNEVLRLLTEGIDRENIAKRMGYTNYKSLDMYVRRKNFHWDSEKQNYVPIAIRYDNSTIQESVSTSKASQVISLFTKEGADAKAIAKRLGFSDHRELASYMLGRGYKWNAEKKNYVKILGKIEESVADSKKDLQIAESLKNSDDSIIEYVQNANNTNVEQVELQQFVPLLIMLQKNKDKLLDLIIPQTDSGTIPRYALPGVFVTKSVHMVSPLDMMVRDFSREKNVSQRDIFAAALIEFFRKYGYEREVEQMLGDK
ncbi:hypothetical protein [Clostridium scatologenes]|uniref:Uncharacterized protein n=1 Tax=Clostridium scatologenes TaxID=1548 RepID=A0A0E3K2K1_CLOSL|nr:hypothetical protein [Clostridium scatologenes]AKA70864.1 hypothetical protein CSCA_3739 [Clostridium scatologenes]